MAVAHDASSESHTGTTGNTGSPNPFTWTHTPSGVPRGVGLIIFTASGADQFTSATYGGVALPEIAGGVAIDSGGEAGRTDVVFLGSNVPSGAQTVSVTRSSTNTMYVVCFTVTANRNTELYLPGIVLVQEDGTVSEQSVGDGDSDSDSLRYAGIAWGGSDPAPAGANSTTLQGLDLGVRTFDVVVETTAGRGSRSVGFNTGATSDDRAAVHFAVREVMAPRSPAVNFQNPALV